jgi:hypothetical protein
LYYYSILIGSSLFQDVAIAAAHTNLGVASACGFLLVLLSFVAIGWLLIRRQLFQHVFPVVLMLYAFLVSALIMYGRRDHGIDSAMWSRYKTPVLMGITGLYLLSLGMARSTDAAPFLKRIHTAVTTLIVVGILGYTVHSANFYVSSLSNKEVHCAYLLRHIEDYPFHYVFDVTHYVHGRDMYLSLAGFLQDKHYSLFHEPGDEALKSDELGLISKRNENFDWWVDQGCVKVLTENSRKYLYLSSWILDKKRQAPVSHVYVRLNGDVYDCFSGVIRGDLVLKRHTMNYLWCGFERCFPMDRLRNGPNTLSVIAVGSDGNDYCETDPIVYSKY